MASSKEYLHFILEQLSDLDDISYRPMMGEFILYYRGKIAGGIYDDRLLVKKTRSALELMPAAICELPYEGAKEMLLVDLCGLHAPFQATYSSSGAMPCMSGRSHIRSVCRRPAAVVVLLSESVQQLVHHLFAERFCLPRCVVLRELHNL